MPYFAALLHMMKPELNQEYRPAHLEYLKGLENEGKVHEKGTFVDGTGGLVIYKADSLEEAMHLAEQDPYVIEGVRRLEIHEWIIK
jgi:uncharacterized protein